VKLEQSLAKCSLLWPGFFTEGDAAQVGDENLGQTELQTGSAEHSITYRAGSYNGIGATCNSVLKVLLLDIDGKLPVGVYNRRGATNGIQPLILPGWPFHANKLEYLIQEGVMLRNPSGGAVSLVGDLLAQPGDGILVIPEVVAQVFEEVHVLEGNIETVFLGLEVRENKAFIVKVHDVLA